MLNGIDSLVVTKLDVFDTQPEIKVCTGYRYKGKAAGRYAAGRRDADASRAGVPHAARLAEADAGDSRCERIAASRARLFEFYFRPAAKLKSE